MLEVQSLWKNYTNQLIDGHRDGVGGPEGGVSFSVKKGEIFGLIGPDGAGKSTLIRLLATLLLPNGGNAWVNGWELVKDYKKIRANIGYMPGVFSLYQDLTIAENLKFFATLFNSSIRSNFHLIKDIYVQIAPFKHRKAAALSGGMKQKLALCCSLIHAPLLLLLDEPTTGVDPVSRAELWATLRRLSDRGVTTVVSTAYMDEATLCDRIAFMRRGEIFLIDTPEGICARYTRPLYSVADDRMHTLLEALAKLPFVEQRIPFGDTHHVTLAEGSTHEQLQEALSQNGFPEAVVQRIEPSVEDAFMAFAGEEA